MAKNTLWQDEYWLLLMQLYLMKPVGVKPLYSRKLVNLSLELHIPPQQLYKRMFRLRSLDEPRLEKLWKKYAKSPQKLAKGVKLLRQMSGLGNAEEFYEGVELTEGFELDFKPLDENEQLLPISLILILDLYFRLTPNTMVKETPEIKELASLLKVDTDLVVEVMEIFQVCDPYLNRSEIVLNPLAKPCHKIWQRYGNSNPEQVASLAAQLKDFFK